MISDFNAPKFDGIEGRDVTIAVVYDLPWEILRPYALSLVRSGFTGLKVLVVDQSTPPGVRENFTQLGFTVVERISPTERTGQWAEFGWLRFYYAAAILRNNFGFRYAIWTDARDVVFQSNPSTWLEKNLSPDRVAVEGLGHTLGACPIHNGPWVKLLCTESEWGRLKNFEVVCTGVIAGDPTHVQNLLAEVYAGCCAQSDRNSTDQGVLNFLVRNAPWDAIVDVPSPQAGFSIVDLGESWNFTEPVQGIPVMNEEGVLCTSETKIPIAIAHLYDRIPAWKEIIKKKYS